MRWRHKLIEAFGDFRVWHNAEVLKASPDVRFRG